MDEKTLAKERSDLMGMNGVIDRPWHLESGGGQVFVDNAADAAGIVYPLMRAREARRHSLSYRAFSVGVCGVIHNRYGMRRTLAHGANFKDAPGDSEIDIHAEEFILNLLEPGDTLVSLAVVAPTQTDSGSGKEDPTLHPCYKCRHKIQMVGESAVNSLIICATPGITAVQWGSVTDYIDYHNDISDNLGTALFSETPPLFHAQNRKPGEPIVLSDEIDIDTAEWDRKVTFPLAEWIRQNQFPKAAIL